MSERRPFDLRIERSFDTSLEEVFEAWTSEEVLRRWFHAGVGWETPSAEVDLRVGGRVRVVMRNPDGGAEYGGERRVHRGRAAAPSGLHLDLRRRSVEHPADRAAVSEREGTTTVVMDNSGISAERRRDSQIGGWNACLDELERALATPSS